MALPIVSDNPCTAIQNELQQEFDTLSHQWREETGCLSSMSAKLSHPAYQRIIRLGLPVVPLILRELELRPGYWFRALADITGETPTGPRDNFEQSQKAWLDWGRQQNYLAKMV